LHQPQSIGPRNPDRVASTLDFGGNRLTHQQSSQAQKQEAHWQNRSPYQSTNPAPNSSAFSVQLHGLDVEDPKTSMPSNFENLSPTFLPNRRE
jgi:hypothetical protein